jgi:hypothetical protein
MTTYQFEYTDTFGGDANYCWVKRGFITIAPRGDSSADVRSFERAMKRRAKARVGLAGVRGEWDSVGDGYVFRPRGMCTILFLDYHDCAGGECACSVNQNAKRGFNLSV